MSERVTVEPIAKIRVASAGRVVAETARGYVIHEAGLPDRYYVPREDIRAELSDGTGAGTCPWKGKWKHLDVRISDEKIANGAWTYHEPLPRTEGVRDFVAFYESKFEIEAG
ncbi:MAG TPA: DUF427 domain-containing protein [Kofleriaceae bacterium]|nr:DUF427 domain-containing protein [Kofleriaceae bacterium]